MLGKFLKFYFAAFMVLSSNLALPAYSFELSESDRTDFQRIISAQINAFQTGDDKGAYAYAAPKVQELFPDVQRFIAMVKRNYQPVYRPRSFRFAEVSEDLGVPTQRVILVDANGRIWRAYYGFERQVDKSWKIVGVALFRHLGLET